MDEIPAITNTQISSELSRRYFRDYSEAIYPTNVYKPFHEVYYSVLDKFAKQEIKKLIITIPSQHGKSEGSSRLLPSYILGQNPDTRIALASYSQSFASKFNRAIQRILGLKEYQETFPDTKLSEIKGSWLRNAHEFEIVDKVGSFIAVGRGGPLSGNPVDVMIMDDLYKDAAEGNSPVIRDSVIEYYSSVIVKRLHNDSQQLIVFTRWHDEDLIGYLETNDNVVEVDGWDDIETALADDPEVWIKINFEAIKESEPTEFDSRELEEALWPERHSWEKHNSERQKQPHIFNCMSQGKPGGSEGLLYNPFRTYTKLPMTIKRENYTDTADTGDDYLCSIDYEVTPDKEVYVTDVVHSQEPMEQTEEYVSKMLKDSQTRKSHIESNTGGRGFARNVQKKVGPSCEVTWFSQNQNKESRILTNATIVNKIWFPKGWETRWPVFYNHVTKYKRLFRSNRYDDAPDVLTGIIEKVNEVSRAQIIS